MKEGGREGVHTCAVREAREWRPIWFDRTASLSGIRHPKQGGLGFADLRCFYCNNRNELDKQSQALKKHIKFRHPELL